MSGDYTKTTEGYRCHAVTIGVLNGGGARGPWSHPLKLVKV